jgi:four helix bundle protein
MQQIRDAADSACRNVAEGFGRYGHREFARFVSISISSLDEVKDCLRAGRQRLFFTDEICEQGLAEVRRARGTMIGLLRYFESYGRPAAFQGRSGRRR